MYYLSYRSLRGAWWGVLREGACLIRGGVYEIVREVRYTVSDMGTKSKGVFDKDVFTCPYLHTNTTLTHISYHKTTNKHCQKGDSCSLIPLFCPDYIFV